MLLKVLPPCHNWPIAKLLTALQHLLPFLLGVLLAAEEAVAFTRVHCSCMPYMHTIPTTGPSLSC